MKIIEKIEIENFRSFLGTRKGEEAIIENILDLNIFSGSNDSGKSNILRALNLFFNGKIDNNYNFDFNNDFNYLKKDQTQKVISIKIFFNISNRKFSITKFYDRYGYRNFEYRFNYLGNDIIIDERYEKNLERYKSNKNICEKEKGYRRYVSGFLGKIKFSYVPAIREEKFFSQLYGKIILKIKENEDKKIKDLENEKGKINRYEKTIKNKSEKKDFIDNLKNKKWRETRLKEIDENIKKTKKLGKAISKLELNINSFSNELFKSINFLKSEFKVGNNLTDFFESFDIGTGENKNISLKLRGDGLQAKYIPEMLNFLDTISSEKYFIWGIEEPENSAEFKNQQELGKLLKENFSKEKQIFLTTHSEEFLSLYDQNDIELEKRISNLYFVYKNSNNDYNEFSQIELFNSKNEIDKIGEKYGLSILRATHSKKIKEITDNFLKQITIQEEEINELNKKIEEIKENKYEKIFICEDEKGIKIWEYLFKIYGIDNIKILSSGGCSNFEFEIYFKKSKDIDNKYNPKVFRQNDRDGIPKEDISKIENIINEKYNFDYKIKFLNVYEIENYIIFNKNLDKKIEFSNEEKNNLELSFIKTASQKILDLKKIYKEYSNINIQNQSVKVTEWKQEAEKDIIKFFPGKEILKKFPNINNEKEFLNFKINNLPKELIDYLDEIKNFFIKDKES